MSVCCNQSWKKVILLENYDVSTPQSFRRIAYFVLMNLSWIPSSPGLRELCYEDEEDNFLLSRNGEKIPAVVRGVFSQMRSTPLPRKECIDKLLDRYMSSKSSVTV